MELSAIEQSPRLRTIYTQLCFCYKQDDSTSIKAIVETLTNGLERLTAGFPWVAGQVIYDGIGQDDGGRFRIVPFESVPQLVVKDHRHDPSAPTMRALRASKFPYSMLDEDLLCPRSTLSDRPNETSSDPYPVLLLQANFISGGLLLTILASHITMDIVGQCQIIKLFSKACHNEPFTTEELNNGNLDRRNLLPLQHSPKQPELTSTTQTTPTPTPQPPSNPSPSTSPSPTPPLIWSSFLFSPSTLHHSKAQTTTAIPPTSSTPYISTGDSITSLLWRSITRVRALRLPPRTSTALIRQVDVRKHMSIPPTYTGNMVTQTTHSSILEALSTMALGEIAATLRSALKPEDLTSSLLAQAHVHTKSRVSARDRTSAITLSSWLKPLTACQKLTFNLDLGAPESIRRPRFTPVEGLVYLLPAQDGGVVAGVCLRDDDMLALRRDAEFGGLAQWVG